MAPIIEQVISLLSTPEGFLIYSLVLGLCAFAALISCLYAEGYQITPTGRRMRLGMMILFIAQLILLISASLGWLGVNSDRGFLPVLDSYLALLSIVIIIWLWAFPEPRTQADRITSIVVGSVIILGIISTFLWSQQSLEIPFNSAILGWVAYSFGLIIVVSGIILVTLRRPSYWAFSVVMLVIFFLGYFGQLILGDPNADYGWYVHLGEMIGFIFILALPQRLVDLQQLPDRGKPAKPVSPKTVTMNPQLVQSMASLFTQDTPQKYYQELTRVIAFGMGADYCLLILPPKTGEQLIIPVGYNRPDDRIIEGLVADGRKLPAIVEAINTSSILQIPRGQIQKLQPLTDQLGVTQDVQLILVPFQPKGTTVEMGLAVLVHGVDVTWSDSDARLLAETSHHLIAMAGQFSRGPASQAESAEMLQKLQHAQANVDQVRLEYAQLKAKYDAVSAGGAVATPLAAEMAVMAENQRNLQETITELENRNRELEKLIAMGRPSIEEVEQLRQELRSALTDLARIPSTLSRSDQKMLEMQLSTVKHLDDLQPHELVNSIAQEFRQPLSSILGYSDLLLGESVGLLGAVQRKFVERVKASAERCSFLLNDLVQVMSIDGGKVEQAPVSMDLKPVIDEALKNVAAQLSEKNMNLRVELPDDPPQILVNEDALFQIMENLIENAYMITPSDGLIRIVAKIEQRENMQSYMHISVSDQGGGIEKTDISRVFLRRYKMENPHIQGIGDMGVGLSIVKSLVELNKGRVWVESKEGMGSTFSVLLPLVESKPSQASPPE